MLDKVRAKVLPKLLPLVKYFRAEGPLFFSRKIRILKFPSDLFL